MHAVDAACVPMASKDDLQLNRATSVVEVLGTPSPSETPDSQTEFSAQGQHRTTPRVQVSLVLSITYTYVIGSPPIIAFILRYIPQYPTFGLEMGPKASP